MSLHEYRTSQKLDEVDVSFYALIMAAMRRADSENAYRLRELFPATWLELQRRHHSPDGLIGDERLEPVATGDQ
jgi:hypothetical protein